MSEYTYANVTYNAFRSPDNYNEMTETYTTCGIKIEGNIYKRLPRENVKVVLFYENIRLKLRRFATKFFKIYDVLNRRRI